MHGTYTSTEIPKLVSLLTAQLNMIQLYHTCAYGLSIGRCEPVDEHSFIAGTVTVVASSHHSRRHGGSTFGNPDSKSHHHPGPQSVYSRMIGVTPHASNTL